MKEINMHRQLLISERRRGLPKNIWQSISGCIESFCIKVGNWTELSGYYTFTAVGSFF